MNESEARAKNTGPVDSDRGPNGVRNGTDQRMDDWGAGGSRCMGALGGATSIPHGPPPEKTISPVRLRRMSESKHERNEQQ